MKMANLKSYNFDVNGDLKRDLAANGIRYTQLAFVLQKSERTVYNKLNKPLDANEEKEIRSAMDEIIRQRKEMSDVPPNKDFMDLLLANHVSVNKLARAVKYHSQTIRGWLSVPLTPERELILRTGLERIINCPWS